MQIQFIFDYRSIYSYLANSHIRTLGASIDFQLVDIVAVMKEVNNQPSPMCPPKAKYSLIDATRWAQIYNVPLSPNAALLGALKLGQLPNAYLSRAGLAAQRLGIFEKTNNALFSAVWAGSADLATEEGRSRFVADHDMPATLWDVADSTDVIEELAANNRRAVANGVFGAPTFFVGDEMFFGNDRLVFVKDRLDAATKGAAQ